MAWIKLDHTTPDKPEMFAIAEHLNCSHGEAFLACIRVWMWADQQSLNGHAINVTEKTLDRISGHAGLVHAMRKAGWLDGTDGAISFPNFDRHNGETAKKRVLAAKRKVTQRSRSKGDNSVTRVRVRVRSIPIAPSGAFLKFWGIWPASSRKQARGSCWDIWHKRDLDLHADEILAHVEALKQSQDWRKDGGEFIPAPRVYLNQRRWEGAEGPQKKKLEVAL